MTESRLVGGIETGGTKIVCAVGTGPDDIRAEIRFPTTTPDDTIAQAIEFFRESSGAESIRAVGVASFGPIDPDPGSATWGYLTNTPKAGWNQIDFVGQLTRALGVPAGFDTDVNGAALGEHRWGAARGLSTFAYLTVGTGIGGGAMVEGRLLHGLLHPEMGHVLVTRRQGDDLASMCPYHDACLEGLASGPAIQRRWGEKAENLPEDHPAWELEAWYLAQGLANLVFALSPERIILGGGVMKQAQLFPLIHRDFEGLIGGYVQVSALAALENYIVPPELGDRAGVLGAIALAEDAVSR